MRSITAAVQDNRFYIQHHVVTVNYRKQYSFFFFKYYIDNFNFYIFYLNQVYSVSRLHQTKLYFFITQIKKYFELEPLARGKSWILDGSTVDSMDTVKESFGQLIHLLEEKDHEIGRI